MRAPLSELPDSILKAVSFISLHGGKASAKWRGEGRRAVRLGRREDRHPGGPRVILVQEARAGQGTARLPFLHRPAGERG